MKLVLNRLVKKHTLMAGSLCLLALTGLGAGVVLAQDDNEADDRRAAFEERRAERMAEIQARRDERWEEFSEENPELAAEIEALRAERQAEREQRRAEFAEQYPNLAAALEEGRNIPGLRGSFGPRADRGPGFGGGRGFDRDRRGRGNDRDSGGPRRR